ncbi:hypothetical protein DFH08DRAFT_818901 [Mycena albidolilacea]|uniref:Uncharacterized protein n=1 Tax=Mycena albidolilacea TaxID=1033008 RepID=A0AAD7EFS1_9AGAR|nr:hypothetical protein DFH08DRAFT_818901 [Mycena albidolilacea]
MAQKFSASFPQLPVVVEEISACLASEVFLTSTVSRQHKSGSIVVIAPANVAMSSDAAQGELGREYKSVKSVTLSVKWAIQLPPSIENKIHSKFSCNGTPWIKHQRYSKVSEVDDPFLRQPTMCPHQFHFTRIRVVWIASTCFQSVVNILKLQIE